MPTVPSLPSGSHTSDANFRVVQLPPENLETCASCNVFKPKVRKNCSCGQVTYCSDECQKDGWNVHKPSCGKFPTDQIDLQALYPLLACLVEKSHSHEIKPRHKALTKTVVSNPTPGNPPVRFSDGWEAAPVIFQRRPSRPLSDPFCPDARWWPEGATPRIREKLYDRIRREGYVLPILTAVCIALLAEVYTSSSSHEESSKRRLRLRYSTGPVADFGICSGKARVTTQDRLGYLDMDSKSETHGQDPEDHYWIYFRTTRGEDLFLDCAMFTFSMNLVVQPGLCTPRSYGPSFSESVPAFFLEREIRHDAPSLHTERARRSVLRDAALQGAVQRSGTKAGFTAKDDDVFVAFMRALARREITATERQLVAALTRDHALTLRGVLRDEEWKRYPTRPETAVIADPVELVDYDERMKAHADALEKKKKTEKKMGIKPRPKHS
ncbi:hypothetical protein BV25DRAFT_1958976 [Artomyces pyxidatus]|uniref:Uncharacterized protein n=1 Tax=Artomyces pyxidatus TaxID=48021 RepID=A0ACB8STC4_9AGAM|nr:hypothetical protein BV25DRAFT_1958976 [Artomyces pyxidatus]